jgi:hypothetical protein
LTAARAARGEQDVGQRREQHRRDGRPDARAADEQRPHERRLDDAEGHERVAEAHQARAERAQGQGVDQVNVARVKGLDVAVQHLAVEHALGDVGVIPVIPRQPHPVVVAEQDRRGEHDPHRDGGRVPCEAGMSRACGRVG